MPPRRRRQRKQDVPAADNRSALPARMASTPEDSPVRIIRDESSDRSTPSSSLDTTKSSFVERCRQRTEAVKETCVERMVDIVILLSKFFRLLGKGWRALNKVTYFLMIVVSQLWLSMAILENIVKLLMLTKLQFHFPLEDFAKFIVDSKLMLAWWFRLVIITFVGIAFVTDSLTLKPPGERLKILCNILFAQVIMYSFLPFMHNFADVMNVVLVIFTCLRIAVEIVACSPDDIIKAVNFLPEALLYHFLFLSLIGLFLTYYEVDKLLIKYKMAQQQGLPSTE